jgi:hypothetical protein
LIPAAYAPPIIAPIDVPAIATGEIPISSNASKAKTCAIPRVRGHLRLFAIRANYRPQRLHFFAIASHCAPTNITPEETLRPFDSIDSGVRSLTCVSNVAPMRHYR